MKKIWHLIWKYFWHLNFLSKLRDKHCWRVSKWQIDFDIKWQIHTFHICKWIFVAISNFSKIDEIISELTALILKDHISSLLSAIYFWSIWTIFETRQTVSNFLLRLIILIGWIEGFKLFRHRHFITGTFRHVDISSPWTFRQGDYLLLTNSRIIVELGNFIAWAPYFLVLNYGRNIHKTKNTH